MKTLQITGYGDIKDNLAIMDMPKSKPDDNEVLIEVHAAGINPIDYKIIGGALKQISSLEFPASIGFDVSGVIVEKGKDVSNYSIGDEVYSRVSSGKAGTYAEYIAVDSSLIAKKPRNLSFVEASGIPLVGETTVQAFEISQLKEGDKVLIHAGSGGIGTFAIQYAKTKGAFVYTTTSTANVEWVKTLGADRVIDYKKENYLEIVKDIDVVYDTLGGQYTVDAFKVIKQGGFVVSISGDMDGVTARQMGLNGLIRGILALKRKKITKAQKEKKASYRFLLMNPSGKQLEEISKLVEENSIKPVVDKTFSLEEGIEALEYQQSGRAKGKIIFKVK